MNCAAFLLKTIVQAVVVVKKAYAQGHELKSNVHRLLLVVNNGCHIYEVDRVQNTPLKIIMQIV